MNENAKLYFENAIGLFLLAIIYPIICRNGCDIDFLYLYILGFVMLLASSLLMAIWGIYEIYYPSPTLSVSEIIKDFIKDIPKLALLAAAGSLYWFISEHSKYQANKQLGIKIFGGKRK